MWILSVYRPFGHLIATGQTQLVLTNRKPEDEVLGPCVIRNLPGDWPATTHGMLAILEAHGADTGPIDNWKTNTVAEIVARADVTQHGTFSNTPEDILRATSLRITGLSADLIQALLGPFVAVPYFLRLENVRAVDPPVPLRRQYANSMQSIMLVTDAGIKRQVEAQTGAAAPVLEPEVVP